MPSPPPAAMTRGKIIGSSQIAGAPRNAPHRPTATMAMTWSMPKNRMGKTARKTTGEVFAGVGKGRLDQC